MSLFKKNQNEINYIGGKKHWIDVIKNSGPGNVLIWRQPEEDFNVNSTLIVMPGESAIFINEGSVEEVFEKSGTYKLSTENYPFISRLRNVLSGGVSTFNSVVYFIRTTDTMEILWGTSTPIQVRDPVLNISSKLQARGAYKIQVNDSVKFLMYLVGNNIQLFSQDELQNYFGSQIMMYIKSYITQFIKNSNTELLGICEYQLELSFIISPFIGDALNPYGLKLVNFSIESLDIPENDPHREQLEEAFSQSGSMNVLGEDWARLKSAEILEYLAQNPGAGGVASMGAGMGMGMVAAPVFANIAQQMFGNIGENKVSLQPEIERESDKSRFSIKKEESKQSGEKESFEKNIIKLNKLRDLGAISQEQYDKKIQEIMDRL